MGHRYATTRRVFVARSLAWLATGLTAGAAPAIETVLAPSVDPGNGPAPRHAPEAGLEVGIQSFSLRRHALEPMLDRLVELGVRRVELIPELEILFYRLGSHLPVSTDPAEIAPIVAAVRSRGLEISASGVHAVSDADEAKRLFEFASLADIPLLTIAPDDDVLDALDRLCETHPRVRLGIHNHGPWTRYETIADVEKTLAGRAPNFGACVDTGHFIRAGEDPIEALRRLGPRVFGVHLKDHREAGFFASGCLLGDGKLDLVACFRALREIGFGADRALSLELEWSRDDLLADLRVCLERAREAMARTSATSGARGAAMARARRGEA